MTDKCQEEPTRDYVKLPIRILADETISVDAKIMWAYIASGCQDYRSGRLLGDDRRTHHSLCNIDLKHAPNAKEALNELCESKYLLPYFINKPTLVYSVAPCKAPWDGE